MKATGIVRRIDDLGRVVVFKEIREGNLIVKFITSSTYIIRIIFKTKENRNFWRKILKHTKVDTEVALPLTILYSIYIWLCAQRVNPSSHPTV